MVPYSGLGKSLGFGFAKYFAVSLVLLWDCCAGLICGCGSDGDPSEEVLIHCFLGGVWDILHSGDICGSGCIGS